MLAWLRVKGHPGNEILRGVSRSFYLSLRLLPARMRAAASLGYLLARTSDTLADSAAVPAEMRLLCLDWFEQTMAGREDVPRWPLQVLNGTADPRERHLLEVTGDLMDWLDCLPDGEARLVREVVGVITGGQRLDIERFASADAADPVALADAAELEDYAWRVAGCVGAFWTKLGFLTLESGFSDAPEERLLKQGIDYGKGLQLVNILRDLPADLATGRCYLPVVEAHDLEALLVEHARWAVTAREWLGGGADYAAALKSRRLRAASALPAMIAVETLDRMRGADWETLRARVKVPRRRVYLACARALAGIRPVAPADSSNL